MALTTCDKCGSLLDTATGKCPACTYNQAAALQARAVSFGDFETAAKLFAAIGNHKDAAARAEECAAAAERCRCEAIYDQAVKRQGVDQTSWQGKAALMRSIAGFRDADTLAAEYQQKADALAAKAEELRTQKEEVQQAAAHRAHSTHKRRRKFLYLGIGTAAAILAIVLGVSLFIMPQIQYKKARDLFWANEYAAAAELFAGIVPYSNSEYYLSMSYYSLGAKAVEAGDDLAAIDWFTKAGNTKSAPEELQAAKARVYDTALAFLRDGQFNEAQDAFNAADDYEDAKAYKHFCRALRVWNGDTEANADKVDLTKAENIIWKTMDGLWCSSDGEREITISAATKGDATPDLVIENNLLQWRADGVSYTVEIYSLTQCRLIADGEYAGVYEKM